MMSVCLPAGDADLNHWVSVGFLHQKVPAFPLAIPYSLSVQLTEISY